MVNSLPPFPAVVREVMALLDSERSSAADVARVIGKDEAITAKVLRLVNSAFYGVPGRVTTVSHAVTLLGFEQLRMVVMGVALLEQGRTRNPVGERARRTLWEHSTASARWAQELARATRYRPAEEAAVASLLHDVGKIVLVVANPREFVNSMALSQAEGIPSFEAEEKTVGFNHVETGRMLCKRWSLPPGVSHAVAMHHHPWSPSMELEEGDSAKLKHLLAIVRVANRASKEMQSGQPLDDEDGEPTVAITPEQLLEKVLEVNALLMD